MIKLYWFEFVSNVAVSLQWQKRQTFKKWQKVLVTKEDRVQLYRLWAKLINETEVSYHDIFKKKVETKKKAVETEKVETEKVEANLE